MPTLRSPKHEKFAQEIVKGRTLGAAYRAAGYAPTTENSAFAAGCRLLKKVNVKERVEQLKTKVAEKAVLTAEKILEELEEARLLAMALEQPSAMVSASMGRAKVAGLIVDKKEIGNVGEFDDMKTEELVEYVQQEAAALQIELQPAKTPNTKGSETVN